MKKKLILVVFFILFILFFLNNKSISGYISASMRDDHPICPEGTIPLSTMEWVEPRNRYINTTHCGDGSFLATNNFLLNGYHKYYTSNTVSPVPLYYQTDSTKNVPLKPDDLQKYAF